jgi:hypothetical protein
MTVALSAGCSFGMTPPGPGLQGALSCSASRAAPTIDVIGGLTSTLIAGVKLGGVVRSPARDFTTGDAAVGIVALVVDVPFWVAAAHGFRLAAECSDAKTEALRAHTP